MNGMHVVVLQSQRLARNLAPASSSLSRSALLRSASALLSTSIGSSCIASAIAPRQGLDAVLIGESAAA